MCKYTIIFLNLQTFPILIAQSRFISAYSFPTSGLFHQPSAIFLLLPLGETERGLLILILPPILLHHGKKLFKLLHPLRLHLPRIQGFTIRLHPIQHISILCHILRRIPMVGLNKLNHLLVSLKPPCLLIHISALLLQPSAFSHLPPLLVLCHVFVFQSTFLSHQPPYFDCQIDKILITLIHFQSSARYLPTNL